MIAALAGGLLAMTWPPLLAWNASASSPRGLYLLRSDRAPRAGDYVVARLPEPARRLAAERNYVPDGTPVLKRVAAVSGQTVCVTGRAVEIDDAPVAMLQTQDRSRRPLAGWEGCRKLVDGEFFLLSSPPDSFDGRYFGPIPRSSLLGKAVPLWTW